MKYTQQAIEKAIENGWNNNNFITYQFFPYGWTDVRITIGGYVAIQRARKDGSSGRWCEIGKYHYILLDPLFWQTLAKVTRKDPPITKEDKKNGMTLRRYWVIYWHRFIDHLAAEHDIESFFEKLLTDNKK